MARIEGIQIKNYRSLKDVTLGKTIENQSPEPLKPLIAVIGPNGSGKSALMDAFGFIGDCLSSGVEEACEKSHRGGFERLRTKEQTEPIKFEIYYREKYDARPISYSLHIDIDKTGRPYVSYERLRQRRKGQKTGWPLSFLEVTDGKGFAWAGEATDREEGSRKIDVKLKN